jgi:hypothetical protein
MTDIHRERGSLDLTERIAEADRSGEYLARKTGEASVCT